MSAARLFVSAVAWIVVAAAIYLPVYVLLLHVYPQKDEEWSADFPLSPGHHDLGPFNLKIAHTHLLTVIVDRKPGDSDEDPAFPVFSWSLIEDGRQAAAGTYRGGACFGSRRSRYCAQTPIEVGRSGTQVLGLEVVENGRNLAGRHPRLYIADYPPSIEARAFYLDPLRHVAAAIFALMLCVVIEAWRSRRQR